WQAPGVGAAGVARGADRDVVPVLQLAVGARLVRYHPQIVAPGRALAALARRGVLRGGRTGRGASLGGRPPPRDRDDPADGDLHAVPDLLLELQVRVFVAARETAGARSARARLLLHRVVRAVGRVGRDGARD